MQKSQIQEFKRPNQHRPRVRGCCKRGDADIVLAQREDDVNPDFRIASKREDDVISVFEFATFAAPVQPIDRQGFCNSLVREDDVYRLFRFA